MKKLIILAMSVIIIGCTHLKNVYGQSKVEPSPQIVFKNDISDEKACNIEQVGFTNESLMKVLENAGIDPKTENYLFSFTVCNRFSYNNGLFIIYQIWDKNKPNTYILMLSNQLPNHSFVKITTQGYPQELALGQRTYSDNLNQYLVLKRILDTYIDQLTYAR